MNKHTMIADHSNYIMPVTVTLFGLIVLIISRETEMTRGVITQFPGHALRSRQEVTIC